MIASLVLNGDRRYSRHGRMSNQSPIDEPIHFTRDTWRGRIRACRGIGAALAAGEVERFEAEHDTLSKDIAGERFTVLHRIVCHMLRFKT